MEPVNHTLPVYSIKDWSVIFEVAESRRCKTMVWLPIPTKQTGRGFLRVARHPQNSRVFSAWVLMLQLAAHGTPRGTLMTEGAPYTAEDMSLKTGFPEGDFTLALEVLTNPAIGWIVATPGQSIGTPGTPRELPVDVSEDPGTPGRHPGTPGQSANTPGLHNKTGHDMTGHDIVVPANAETTKPPVPAGAGPEAGLVGERAPSASHSISATPAATPAEKPGHDEAEGSEAATGNTLRVSTNEPGILGFVDRDAIERGRREQEPAPAKKRAEKAPKVELPPLPFNSTAFASAWADYVEMRIRKRAKPTARAAELIFGDLIAWGEDKAVRALQNSTKNNWTGVFDPDAGRGARGHAAPVSAPELPEGIADKVMGLWNTRATKRGLPRIELMTPERIQGAARLWRLVGVGELEEERLAGVGNWCRVVGESKTLAERFRSGVAAGFDSITATDTRIAQVVEGGI